MHIKLDMGEYTRYSAREQEAVTPFQVPSQGWPPGARDEPSILWSPSRARSRSRITGLGHLNGKGPEIPTL